MTWKALSTGLGAQREWPKVRLVSPWTGAGNMRFGMGVGAGTRKSWCAPARDFGTGQGSGGQEHDCTHSRFPVPLTRQDMDEAENPASGGGRHLFTEHLQLPGAPCGPCIGPRICHPRPYANMRTGNPTLVCSPLTPVLLSETHARPLFRHASLGILLRSRALRQRSL